MLSRMAGPTRDQNKFIIRMPEGLRDRIQAAAERRGRSMNSEIVLLLEAYYPERPTAAELVDELKRTVELAQGRDLPGVPRADVARVLADLQGLLAADDASK